MSQWLVKHQHAAVLVLLVGDLVALLLFVFVGQRDHDLVNPDNPLLGVLLAGLPFLPAWIIAAFVLGAYRIEASNRVRRFMARSLNAWLVAAPLGIIVRSLMLGRAVVPTLFLIAAMGFGGLFVLTWRFLFAVIWSRGQR